MQAKYILCILYYALESQKEMIKLDNSQVLQKVKVKCLID